MDKKFLISGLDANNTADMEIMNHADYVPNEKYYIDKYILIISYCLLLLLSFMIFINLILHHKYLFNTFQKIIILIRFL